MQRKKLRLSGLNIPRTSSLIFWAFTSTITVAGQIKCCEPVTRLTNYALDGMYFMTGFGLFSDLEEPLIFVPLLHVAIPLPEIRRHDNAKVLHD